MTTAIEASQLTKVYGDHAAVNDLNLVIPAGASVGLLGPNGAGKSTTLKMLLGLARPTSGQATVLGLDASQEGAAIRGRTGYVPERHHIYGWMTVSEVLRFARPFYPTWNDQLCAHLIESYALPLDRKVKQLSHGMGTKLSLVLALAHEPELLILDEPTTGLDPLAREEFVEAVGDLLKSYGKTVLFSSHILSDVEQIAETIAIMCDGRLLAMSPRRELLATTKRVHLTLDSGQVRPALPEQAVFDRREGEIWTWTVKDFSEPALAEWKASSAVRSLQVSDISLEDIFKDYIKGASAA